MTTQFETFDVVIDAPPPYGFRLVQKLMDNTLVVSKLRQGGKAEESGLKEGDTLLAVNSRSCGGFNCTQALNLIDSASQPLVLSVKRKAGSHPKPTNQPVIVRDLNFLPKKKPAQPPAVQFKPKPSPEPTPGPPETTVTPIVALTLSPPTPQQEPQKSPASEPTRIFVGSTYKEQKEEEEKPRKVEIGTKSSILVEPPSNLTYFTDSTKKTYTDSSFFNDPGHKYPTLEEQVQLARMVAMSVLSPVNADSKGHKMFMRAKERSSKYTTGGGGGSSDEEAAGTSDQPGDPHLQHMPKKIAFVPKLPEESSNDRMNAMSNEELELMRLQGRKTTHTDISPRVCFGLADDLKNLKGKGGRLFAKRQAKAESWAVGGGGGDEETEVAEEEVPEKKEREQKKVMDKLATRHQMEKATRGEEEGDSPISMGYGQAPVNRLDSMVKANKAAMTPWQAAAEYGNVNKAFEHLDKIDSQLNPGPQRVAPNARPTSWTASLQQPQPTDDFAKMTTPEGRSPGYRPVKFPLNSSIEPPAGIPISDA